MSKPGNMWRKVHGKITKKPTNFSWLLDNNLAGSGIPTSKSEVDWVVMQQNIQAIVTMTEYALPKEWIRDVNYLHVPTPDLTAPSLDELDHAVDFIHKQIQEKHPVMVHCAAGLGRAGTVLACYFVKYHKYTARDVIEMIRNKRPGSIQSQVQETAIKYYEKQLLG